MAGLDISPANLSGLAALASRGDTNLNLPVPGELGLKALQLNMQQDQAKKEELYKLLALQQQARSQDYQTLASSRGSGGGSSYPQSIPNVEELKQQLAALNQPQLNQTQQQANPQQKVLESLQKEMTKLLDEDDASTKEKGEFALQFKNMLDQASTPEEAHQIRNEGLKIARANKYLTSEEVDAASKLPLSQFKRGLEFKAMQYGLANKYKDSQKGTEEVSPDTSELSAATKTQAQKDIVMSEDNIRQLEDLFSQVPDNFFGASSLGQQATKAQEWGENIPGIGKFVSPSKEAKADLKKYSSFQGKAEGLSLQIIKQLSGVAYTDAQLEYLKSILPSIGASTTKSQFEGRSQALFDWFNGIKEHRQNLLKNKIPLGSKEYNKQMKDFVLPSKDEEAPPDNYNELRQFLKKKNKYSDEEIETYIDSKRNK